MLPRCLERPGEETGDDTTWGYEDSLINVLLPTTQPHRSALVRGNNSHARFPRESYQELSLHVRQGVALVTQAKIKAYV